MRRLLRAVAGAVLVVPFGASVALAHPLGNFTINHYAGIRVEPDRVLLDVVIDEAEIPTFGVTAALDRDADGTLSAAETAGLPVRRCLEVGRELTLSVDGAVARLRLTAAGVTFPLGNAGLPTMRSACAYDAPIALAPGGHAAVTFRDDLEPARIGWREITAVGDRVTVDGRSADGGRLPTESPSARLTAYPDALGAAPDVRAVTVDALAGGAAIVPFLVPDASPVAPVDVVTGAAAVGAASATDGPGQGSAGTLAGSSTPTTSTVAGDGVPAGRGAVVQAGEGAVLPAGADAVPAILGQAPVSPVLAIVALLTAAALGAGHALTPGHGKTLMAAYLVGTRGTPRHAVGLGLAVSVSHTAGILVLAVVILAAERTLPADVVVRIAPVVAAVTILGIGAWMLGTEVRRRMGSRPLPAGEHAPEGHDHGDRHDHVDAHGHDHAHEYDHGHDHGNALGHEHEAHAPGHAHGHEHEAHDPGHAQGPHAHGHETHRHDHDDTDPDAGLEHRHGPVAHRHVPRGRATVTWRGLFVLGLAGGLVPSANALLVLLGSIAAGRPAWGVVLVASFGLGMAAVMAGIGLACVYARGLVGRVPIRKPLAAAGRLVPLGAAVVVLAIGLVLTGQAIAAVRLG